MTRRMTITVINTGINEKWLFNSDDLKHGKWMDDGPAQAILQDSTAILRTEKTTGSAYGTTGWIEYNSSIVPGSTMKITWNKPYGSDPTTCTVTMSGETYSASVENIDFQKSEAFCDVVIKTN